MANERPQSRPDAPKPATGGKPSVYGDQWGKSGKQNPDAEKGHADRPDPIDTPAGPQGPTPD